MRAACWRVDRLLLLLARRLGKRSGPSGRAICSGVIERERALRGPNAICGRNTLE